jgi:hypothetical protein
VAGTLVDADAKEIIIHRNDLQTGEALAIVNRRNIFLLCLQVGDQASKEGRRQRRIQG